VFWESLADGASSGISQCLSGRLPSTVKIDEDIVFKGFGMIIFYIQDWVAGLNEGSSPSQCVF
jgi:hypothetical protein